MACWGYSNIVFVSWRTMVGEYTHPTNNLVDLANIFVKSFNFRVDFRSNRSVMATRVAIADSECFSENDMALSFPASDNALQAWSANFLSILSAAPAGAYGVTSAQITAYGTVNSAYVSALAACDPNLRNKAAVVAKNSARLNLKNAARLLANTINGVATVTAAQKTALGLNVRVRPTPVPAPTTAPGVDIVSVSAWTVKLKMHDTASSAKRGKPPGVSGASMFSYVGATPPADMAAWQFEGMTGKTDVTLSFATSNPPGTKVWFSAFWFNGRKESGPTSAPISANLPGGSVSLLSRNAA